MSRGGAARRDAARRGGVGEVEYEWRVYAVASLARTRDEL